MADDMPSLHQPQAQAQLQAEGPNGTQTILPPSSSATTSAGASVASRRPPRKSTLTQQQKNQKRQRATQDQLMTLEIEFNKNPTPTALVRERIAQDINMTERSVQIWFQNRRAKIKNIAKRSIESGEDCDSIPESMRQYLANQHYDQNKGLGASLLGRTGLGFTPYGNGTLGLNTDASTGKTVIHHFHCRSLSIGSWRRVGQSTMDLVIFYSPEKACLTYYINNDSAGYKIEYPFAWIKTIALEQGDVLAQAEGASQRLGGLVVELIRPPKFYMDSSGGGFYECGDFTEEQQGSQIMVHHLGGPSKVLSGQLAKLASLEAYQNRHNMFDPSNFAVSAPVSPVAPRPASQPNHMMHNPMNLFPPEQAPGMMGPPGPRGHKRQRSRSVPVAIDFSMLRHPMPSFLIEQHGQPAQAHIQDPAIFAPQPQHQHHNGFAPGPMGPNLSIDTSAGYGMDFRQMNGPMSATTVQSPSDFGTPGFFTSGPMSEAPMPTSQPFNTPFNHNFLAVDPASMIGTSNTPLSITSHGDPIIADHSPPLTGMGRSQSADMFATPGGGSHFGDDSTYLSESFNKQIQLPFRSPLSDEPFHSSMPEGMLNFQSPPPNSSGSQLSMQFRTQDGQVVFQSPSHQTQDGSMTFPSPIPQAHQPQLHQDSGVASSTASQMSQEQATTWNSPKDIGVLYPHSRMYQSPGPMQQLSEEQSMYHQSPLGEGTPNNDVDMQHMGMYGTIDPNSLGQHQRH